MDVGRNTDAVGWADSISSGKMVPWEIKIPIFETAEAVFGLFWNC